MLSWSIRGAEVLNNRRITVAARKSDLARVLGVRLPYGHIGVFRGVNRLLHGRECRLGGSAKGNSPDGVVEFVHGIQMPSGGKQKR